LEEAFGGDIEFQLTIRSMASPSPDLSSLNPASKEYLEAVYELEEEGRKILQARISERLGLAPATVSEGVRRLIADGYVTIQQTRQIALTDTGRTVAETLVRRHRLAERMITDLLGLPWHSCHDQALDWEKVMTPEIEQAILDHLQGDHTCPHGNPIPGTTSAVPWAALKPVAAMAVEESGTLTRLLEDVELDHDVLLYLEKHSLMPGHELKLVETAPDGTRILEVDSSERVGLGVRLADNLWILPA
jgi:DtxR family transcriptional regulator, Mn-dependent transcriptional regulator